MADSPLTLEVLEKRRIDSLRATACSIRNRPEIYRELKALLQRVLWNPLDISDYYKTARDLAHLIEALEGSGGETIFPYYSTHIDPRKKGDARYFRAMCRDLSDQIVTIEEWRKEYRQFRIVK